MVEQRLRWLQRRLILNDAVAALLFGLGFTGLGLFLVSVFFLTGGLLLIALLGAGFIFWYWLRQTRLRPLAYRVERFFPVVQGRLVAGLDLARYQGGREGYSLELRKAALAQVEELFAPLPLGRLLPRRRILLGAVVMFFGLVFLGISWWLMPSRTAVGLRNGFFPARVAVVLKVLPGDTAVLPGAEVRLFCRVNPAGIFPRVRLETKGGRSGREVLPLVGDSCGTTVLVSDGFAYRFSLLGRSSRWFSVALVEPLGLRRIQWTVHPPAYTGLPGVSATGGEITALAGSVVDFVGEVNQAIGAGRWVFGAESAAVVIAGGEPNRFSGRFVVQRDGELRLALVPVSGGGAQTVARVAVRAIPDEPPLVRVFLPGRDIDLPMTMQVPLGINSIDDFGLGELWLHYGKVEIDRVVRLKRLAGEKEDTTFYLWDLADAGLLPGDALRYYVRVTDNDRVAGPKSGRSEVFVVRFPTMSEIYASAVQQTQSTSAALAPIQGEQAKVGEELARLSEEIKKNRELSWEERRRLEEVVGEQQRLFAELAAVQEELERKAAELLEGMNWDQETFAALNELQELMNQLLSPELRSVLQELQQRLGERSGEIRQALERMRREQEKLKAGLQRALEFLKMAMEEQRLEALARQAEELAQEEERVNRAVSADSLSAAAERQEAINSALDSLQEEMAKLAAEISEPEIADSLAALMQEMEQKGWREMASRLQEQLAAGQRQEAKRASEEMSRGFRELAERLNSLSEQLKNARSAAVLRQLLAAADGLIAISRAEEELEGKLSRTAEPAGLAPEQMGLWEATRVAAESLAGLGSKTLRITPELGQEIARALNAMRASAGALAEGRGATAAGEMAAARRSLNRAVLMVLSAAGQEAQGGGMKAGLQSLLEQLAKMAAEQMAINAGMSGIPIPIPVSGLSAEQRGELARLFARQQALRQELEKFLQSIGGERPGLTGSLDRLVDEMKAVERALSELQVDRRLIERQEGILSRLLDAQRSLRQQGFKEERQAQTAQEYQIETPPPLPEDRGERNRLLREELLRALRQGYPLEYERLIRSYFERLLQE